MKQVREFRCETLEQLSRAFHAARAQVEAGRVLKVALSPWKKRRSIDQNARYWAILTAVAAQMPPMMNGVWYAPEVWHEHYKRRFLPMLPGPGGSAYPQSTTSLSTSEFVDYCDQVEADAIEQGVFFEAYP